MQAGREMTVGTKSLMEEATHTRKLWPGFKDRRGHNSAELWSKEYITREGQRLAPISRLIGLGIMPSNDHPSSPAQPSSVILYRNHGFEDAAHVRNPLC